MTDADLAAECDADRPLLALVREHGREDAGYLAVGLAFQAAKSFVGFADALLVGLAIDALFNGRPLALPLVPDAWIPGDPTGQLLLVAGLLFAVHASTVFGGAVSDVGFGVFAERFLHRVRVAAFDATQHRRLAYFDAHRTGDVLSALNDDVNQLETFFTVLLGASVWIAVSLVAAVVYMAALNWQLAVFVLASAPVVAACNYRFAARLEPRQDAVRRTRGTLNAHLDTSLDGVGVLKAFTAADAERERVAAASRDYLDARFEKARLAVRQTPLNRVIAAVWLLGTLALGLHWMLVGPPPFFSGTLTAGEFVPFVFYLQRVRLPLRNLAGVVDGYEGANAAARRVHALAQGGDDPDETAAVEVSEGRVTVDDVTFTYPDADAPAVDGVSLDVEAGETVGVVGATGAGKSTLVQLLLGLYDPDSGTIAVDGRDLGPESARAFREHVGYVSQDAFLFDDTVRHNVAYGASGEVDDEHVRAAAETAGVHQDVAALPDGYDTEVGEHGVKLSGGQRQRLALARAVVGDPAVLVLDEATSHVDTETERRIQANLAAVTADRTTFVVAHRLATVRAADRIVVLDDGEVVESGTHDELVDRDGVYADLWRVQVGSVAAD